MQYWEINDNPTYRKLTIFSNINNYITMTTELFKKTEETTMVEGVEVKKVTQLETIIKDGNGNEIGRIHVNQWGGNFNLNNGQLDVQEVNDGIINILTPETV